MQLRSRLGNKKVSYINLSVVIAQGILIVRYNVTEM